MNGIPRQVVLGLSLLGLLVISPGGSLAQDREVSTPGAADCIVEPRTEAEILAIVASATPVTAETYEEERQASEREWEGVTVVGLADFATQRAVRDTMWQLIACTNANMPLNVYALYTEDAISRNQPSADELRGEDPTAGIVDGEAVEQGPIALLDVLSVQVLSNGQATAICVFDSTDIVLPVESFSFYFEEVDGRWLVDNYAL